MISSTPCTVSSGWYGWRQAACGLRARSSWTLGLYFMVQVPWPTSMLKSAPRVCWESRTKCRKTCGCEISGSAGGRSRRMPVGQCAQHVADLASRIPFSTSGSRMPRSPLLLNSKMMGSSQRAWW